MTRPVTAEDLLEAFKRMTLLELSQFVKQFEETFGVSAVAPAPGPVPVFDDLGEPAEEEQDEFDVILQAPGDKKIQVIKEVRGLTKLGLKEAKDLVDAAPSVVLAKADKDAAEKAQAVLAAAGAEVTLR